MIIVKRCMKMKLVEQNRNDIIKSLVFIFTFNNFVFLKPIVVISKNTNKCYAVWPIFFFTI